jgi:hypothetical protein
MELNINMKTETIHREYIKKVSLATGYLADAAKANSPLRAGLQKLSVSLLQRDITTSEMSHMLDEAIDLIDLGRVDNSISQMNAKIYIDGIRKFKARLNDKIQDDVVATLVASLGTSDVQQKRPIQLESAENNTQPEIYDLEEETLVVVKEQDARKQKILKVLKENAASLADIKAHFNDITSKTLQRDLADLLSEKRIVRMGDRRWAKYYLK